MKILDLLYETALEHKLEFMLIGGHAINVIGDRRQTRDIDIVVCSVHSDKWQEILTQLNYQLFHKSDAFIQFKPSDIADWPIDIMLVDEVTFDGLMAEASSVNLGGEHDILMPSSKHLIAMKLHALKQADTISRLKDLLDLTTLVKHGKIDIQDKAFERLCLKYGTRDIYEELIKYCS